MVPISAIAFVVLKILHDLVSMQKSLLTNNCWRKQNFEKSSPNLYFHWTFSKSWQFYIKLLCVTMWKRFTLTFPTIWHKNFWLHTCPLENRNLWAVFQSAITWKQGITQSRFLCFSVLCYYMGYRLCNGRTYDNHITNKLASIRYFLNVLGTILNLFGTILNFLTLILIFFAIIFVLCVANNWFFLPLN